MRKRGEYAGAETYPNPRVPRDSKRFERGIVTRDATMVPEYKVLEGHDVVRQLPIWLKRRREKQRCRRKLESHHPQRRHRQQFRTSLVAAGIR